MAEQEEDFSSLPLPDRFLHKNWKVRKEAYEAAAKEFDSAQTEADPSVRLFVQDPGLWKGAVTDANAAAHQEALAALCSFLQIAGTQGCTRTRGYTTGPLAEKGLVSTKPAAKAKALEAILLNVELDKPDPVIEELLPLLSHKTPKVIAATLAGFTSIYHAFGCKTVDPKPVLKTLPKVFGHADKNVRQEAQNLTVELYRWLREGMKPMFWNDLKPVQQQDLEKLFENVKNEPPPQQERLLRSQQAAAAAAPPPSTAAVEEDGGYDDADAEVDFEPEVIAVDVFAKIPKDFQERISSTKWKDRKDVCDEVHAAVNCPAMEDGPFDDILRPLAKCCHKDANISVVTVAANCIELIAKGLRRTFNKYRTIVFSPLMERLKERKQSVTDALAAALDAVFLSASLSECLDETLEFLKHKNPQVKLESTRFLTRCLKMTKTAPTIPEVKLVSDAATGLLADAQETQRNASAEILGVLLKIMGDRIMNTHLEGLDDIKKAKIKEFAESAEVKAKYKPKAAAPPKPAPAAAGKRPMATKKPATGAATVARKPPTPVEDAAPSPLQPRPTARPVAPKTSATPTAPRGLRPPTAGMAGRKLAQPPQSPAPAQSPRRSIAPPQYDNDQPAPPKPAARGLTGRPLGKAPAQAPEPAPQQTSAITGLSSAERIELDELRAEVERLRSTNETLRSETMKLSSQVHELQNQNAELIEDHTRDVLSIKAKETQLVRSRSDAEAADQNVQHLQREVERLKRELSRIGRATASPPTYQDVFQESSLGANSASTTARPAVSSRSRGGVVSPTENLHEGKENFSNVVDGSKPRVLSPPVSSADSRPASQSPVRRPASRPVGIVQAPSSFSTNANGSALLSDGEARSSGGSSANGVSSSQARTGEAGSQQESWKRAAEVTQNLKARIELMKAKQGLSKG